MHVWKTLVASGAYALQVVLSLWSTWQTIANAEKGLSTDNIGKNRDIELFEECATMTKTISPDYLLAGNPSADPEDLSRLASDIRASVRLRVAENMNASDDALQQLAADEDEDVRIAVAENPICPGWLRIALSKDESPTVRYAIAEDCHTSFDILLLLKDDENAYVQQAAKYTMASIELEFRTSLVEAGFVQISPPLRIRDCA